MQIVSREVEEMAQAKTLSFENSWLKRKSFAKRLNFEKLDMRLVNFVLELFHTPPIYRG